MIGDMICKLRKKKDISQSTLGEALSLSASAIGMYEQNRRLPDADTLVSLCNYFSVSSDYILELSEDSRMYPVSETNDTIRDRIALLIEENDLDIDFIASITKIRKRRLNDILSNGKRPDANELILLSECFDELSDYLLGMTDKRKKKASTSVECESFAYRLTSLMDSHTESEVAMAAGIPIYALQKLLSGAEEPTPGVLCSLANYFQTSTDYLLALTDNPREADPDGSYPFDINDLSIERLNSLVSPDDYDSLACELSLTYGEVYNLFHYGFLPHLNVLVKLCRMYSVSSDYLLGISDSKLSIVSRFHHDENDLLESYRKLTPVYRKKVDGYIADQLIQQERDEYMRSSVAAEPAPLKEAK